MKHPFGMLSFLVTLIYLTACTKSTGSSNNNESTGINGKWNLVSDSTFKGVGTSNHPVDYIAVAGDYFTFDANGHVYTRENTVLDTLTYRLVSDTTILISDFGFIIDGVPDTSTVSGFRATNGLNITVQTLVLESPFFATPGGAFWRKVTLSR